MFGDIMLATAHTEDFATNFGKYQLITKIASGGMAEIYRARLAGLAGFEKTVVVKRLHPHLLNDRDIVDLFVNEAKLAAKLHHRNVVQVFELDRLSSGELYIVMEHVEGADLRHVLRLAARHKIRLPPWLSAYVMLEVLEGLSFVHALSDDQGRCRHVVHRDVSPSNIFMSNVGDVKLGDFGIAKDPMRANVTQPGSAIRGKAPYMSPEQIAGRELDGRSDIFSAGIVLWECLTQRRLYSGLPEFAAMNEICFGKTKPPSTLSPDITPALDACVLRALERDPAARFQSARAFHEELQAALAQIRPQVQHADVCSVLESLRAFDSEGSPAEEDGEALPDPLAELGEHPDFTPGLFTPSTPSDESAVVASIAPASPPCTMTPSMPLEVPSKPVVPIDDLIDVRAHRVVTNPPPAIQTMNGVGEAAGPDGWRAMIRNTTAPGGSPFWIKDDQGTAGPLAYDDVCSGVRWAIGHDRRSALEVAAEEGRWISLERFLALTGQEMIGDPDAHRDVALPKSRITGSLTNTSAAALLCRLARDGATGRLFVVQSERGTCARRELWIDRGRPLFVYANSIQLQMPQQLTAMRLASQTNLPELIHASLRSATPLETTLARRNGSDAGLLRGALMKERLLDVFRWKSARYAFEMTLDAPAHPPFAPSLIALLPEMISRTLSVETLRELLASKLDTKLVRSGRYESGVAALRLNPIQAEALNPLGGGRKLRTSLENGVRDERFQLVIAYLLLELELLIRRGG